MKGRNFNGVNLTHFTLLGEGVHSCLDNVRVIAGTLHDLLTPPPTGADLGGNQPFYLEDISTMVLTGSVTRKKSPNVYKSCLKMVSLEK